MSRMSFAEAADRVKGSLDIVDVIQRHVVLKKSGRNYMGKCPFHNDKNPSMNVSREKGIFKCFSCGVGGDSLAFLMRIENKTYGEIIRDLAQEQGIDILYEGQDADAVTAQKDARQKILELNQAAGRWFEEKLAEPAAQSVLDYLAKRYPDPAMRQKAMVDFHLGYAPPGWENLTPHLKSRFDFVQANPDLLVTAGLANSRDYGQGHYDRFRHRLIIPIHDEKGQTVAFGGRALINADGEEDKPKYLNSPETILYHKSNVLYGLNLARESIRQSKAAVVMEGYFDVMTAHLAGVTEAVGSCGTAMTDSHLKLLTRFGAETVYLSFDSDEAGLKAALSAIHLIEPMMQDRPALQLKIVIVPDGKDPDDFIRQHGGDAFRNLMREAKHFLEFKLDMAIRGLDFSGSEGRLEAVNRLVPALASIQRPTVRLEYAQLYASRVGVSEEAILLEVKRYEQVKNPVFPPNSGNFKNFGKKKAISKYASTSLWRERPMLIENVAELRSALPSRREVAEKNLIRLALYNLESYHTMMSLMETRDIEFSSPVQQRIMGSLRALSTDIAALETQEPQHAFGTLTEKMNHLYLNDPDVLHMFAELVLTAESFGDSLGLGELKGLRFREKVTILAEQQISQIATCNRMQQLRDIKRHAAGNEEEAIEALYRFRDSMGRDPGVPE